MSSPFVSMGYFLSSCDSPEQVQRCVPQEACLSQNTSCTSKCSEGYTGDVCSLCSFNYYRSGLACLSCPTAQVKSITLLTFSVVFMIILFRMVRASSRIPVDARICIQFLQTIALYPSITTKWPNRVLSLMRICSFSNVDIELLSPECAVPMDFWTKQRIKTAIPFVLFGAVSALHFFRSVARMRSFGFDLHQLRLKLSSSGAFIFVSLFTSSVSATLSPFYCDRQSDRKYILLKNPSIHCFDAVWKSKILFFIIFALIYLVFAPCFCISLFVRHGKDSFIENFGYLTSPYRRSFSYWELVVLLKRALFAVSNNFLEASNERLWFPVLILLIFFWFDCATLPYSTRISNELNITWSMICIIVLLCQPLIFENDLRDEAAVVFDGFLLCLIVFYIFVSVKRVLEKLFKKNQQTLLIPAIAMSDQTMPRDLMMEVHNLNSTFHVEANGSLEVHMDHFLEYARNLPRNPFATEYSAIQTALSTARSTD
eukprot:TRINITY_DN15984_c1_g1_i5.p1 TRINITY_DN15984_c1_g1~~TRINITY_DN15984_c1_g1_i5.p1  ORF type:complete len:485 (+),score=75.65 TRINITY_DN15984_c1_g1_i5:1-1455(+)